MPVMRRANWATRANLAELIGILLVVAGCSSPSSGGGVGGRAGGAGSSGGSQSGGTTGASGGGGSGGGTTVCGFVMPNPASSGLPNPASYDTSVAGTVTDTVTGLAWEHDVSGSTYTAADARAYCQASTLGGHSDWRLPAVVELTSLLDYTRASPMIDPVAFPNTPADFYWASTSWGGSNSITWVVDFDAGESTSKDDGDTYHVRCVRATGTPAPRCASAASRYQVSSGLVSDVLTGLTWQQTISDQRVTWDAARTQCASLGAGFRLPSLTELPTLIDYTVPLNNPSLDLNAFPGTAADEFWTSSTVGAATGTAWILSFSSGATNTSDVTFVAYSRCVR
jgi:hypothetical protein